MQAEAFTLFTDSTKIMHGILPEDITEALEYNDIDYEGLLPRLLQERPQRPRSSGAPAGARREEGEQSSGGSNKPDDDSKATAKKPGTAESKEDEDEEDPDHCGDLATFVEGRQIIEWVSQQYDDADLRVESTGETSPTVIHILKLSSLKCLYFIP